jgi:hypothetical protein
MAQNSPHPEDTMTTRPQAVPPRRIKESATSAFQTAGYRAKQVPAKVKQVPELTRQHPRAAAAVGGAAALAVGATAWIMGRSK